MKIEELQNKFNDINPDENKKQEIWNNLKRKQGCKHSIFIKLITSIATAACIFGMVNLGTYVYAGESIVTIITKKWGRDTQKDFYKDDINNVNVSTKLLDFEYTICDYVYDEKASEIYITVKVKGPDARGIADKEKTYYVEDKGYSISSFDSRKYESGTIDFGICFGNSKYSGYNLDYQITGNDVYYYISGNWDSNSDGNIKLCIIRSENNDTELEESDIEYVYTIDKENCVKPKIINMTYNNTETTVSPYCITFKSYKSKQIDDEIVTITYKDGRTVSYDVKDSDSDSVETDGRDFYIIKKLHLTKPIDIDNIKSVEINGELKFTC